LEEYRQAEAILKEFTKGTPGTLLPDSAANQLAMNNMMSPGRRVARYFVAKEKKNKVVVPRKKKNNHPRHALPMFNDPV
jgi:phage anti-repressor protein